MSGFLTHVAGPPEPYPVQRTLMLRIAKSGRRLPDPELEILCVKHHLQKIHRQRLAGASAFPREMPHRLDSDPNSR